MNNPHDLKALASGSAHGDAYQHGPNEGLLERFKNPMTGPGSGSVSIEAPEFTSLCPLTGQPDFATIVVEYGPRDWCVESKAFKLFLGSFRNSGEFHEACVQRIANALIWLLDPLFLRVEGQFTPRGGIPFWPTVSYSAPFAVRRHDDVEPRASEYRKLSADGRVLAVYRDDAVMHVAPVVDTPIYTGGPVVGPGGGGAVIGATGGEFVAPSRKSRLQMILDEASMLSAQAARVFADNERKRADEALRDYVHRQPKRDD